jgi:polysaccharide chain length determinant protein (PEP-CTERM system associated)
MADEARQGGGLDRVWSIWGRRKWLAVLVFAAPFAALVSLIAFLPDFYKSSVLILVDRQQMPEEFARPTVTGALEGRLQRISQEILSRSRLADLIARHGLYPELRKQIPEDAVIQQMRQDIDLELRGQQDQQDPQRPTVAFTLSYRGRDSQKVALITNTLAAYYAEENIKVRERQADSTAEFLQVQLNQAKVRLDQQERNLAEFKKRYVGELPQEREANLAFLERLNAQLRLNNDSQARALAQREVLTRQIAEVVPGVGPVDGPDAATVRLARLREELAQLRTSYTDKYPDVIRLKTEIADLERQLAEPRPSPTPRDRPPTVGTDPATRQTRQAVAGLDAELKLLKAEEAHLRGDIATYQHRVENTPKREQEYTEVSRDYDATKELYTSLLRRYSEAKIAVHMEQGRKGETFQILERATPATTPAAPNRRRLIFMAAAASAALAAGAILLAEGLDTSFHTVDELRAFTAVPVLVSIPRIVSHGDRTRHGRRLRLAALCAMLGLAVLMGASFFVAHENERLVTLLSRRS